MKNQTISYLIQKGGAAKSASSISSVSALQDLYKRAGLKEPKILIIDTDEQNNIRTMFGVRSDNEKGSLYDIIVSNIDPIEAVTPVRESVWILSSGGRKLNLFLQKMKNSISPTETVEQILNKKLQSLKPHFDYIFIDTPPSMGEMSAFSILFSDYVIIPVPPDTLSMLAAKSTAVVVEGIAKTYKECNCQIAGIMPVLFDKRRKLDTQLMETLEHYIDQSVFGETAIMFNPIRTDSKMPTSVARKKLIGEVFPKSNVFCDYKHAMLKLLQKILKDKNFTKLKLEETTVIH